MGRRAAQSAARQGLRARIDAFVAAGGPGVLGRWTVAAAMVTAACLGLERLDRWTSEAPGEPLELRIQWAEVPDWLQVPENQHIFDDLVACTGLRRCDKLSDPHITQRVYDALNNPQVGWIKRPHRIIKQYPDRLVVHCEFRQPAAWVQSGAYAYLVDVDGVRLPGRYSREAATGTGLLEITGVRDGPPSVGAKWSGADSVAALSIVSLLGDRPFGSQITGISVENFGMRIARYKPQIELLTDRPGSRVCWGRAPGAEDATEISAAQKIDLLNTLYQRWGRVDMDRSYIDITTFTNKVALPAAIDPEASEPTIRG